MNSIFPHGTAPFGSVQIRSFFTNMSPKLLVAADELNIVSNLPIASFVKICPIALDLSSNFVLGWDKAWFPLSREIEWLKPHTILGAMAFTSHGQELLRRLFEEHPSFTPPVLPIFSHDSEDPALTILFSNWLQAALWESTKGIADRNVAFGKELALLRKQYEHLQANYTDLENYVFSFNKTPHLVFSVPPSQQSIAVPKDLPPGHWITQELPVASRGFASVSLHIPAGVPTGEGRLLAEIFAHDSQRILDCWDVPFTSLQLGWNTLARHRAEDVSCSESLQLRLCWHPDTNKAPALSLGNIHPEPDAWVCAVGAQRQPHRPLAFQVCRFVPGLRLPQMPNTFYPTERSASSGVLRLPGWMLQGVEDISVSQSNVNFAKVSYIEEEGELLIHPLEDSLTIGRLPLLCPPGTLSVSATVRTASSLAGAIDYALAVLPPHQSVIPLLRRPVREAAIGFSGWQLLESMLTSQVRVEFSDPTATHCHLYMITRIPEGARSHNCWARFFDFTLYSRPSFEIPKRGNACHGA